MSNNFSGRVVLAAPRSNSGKTTITCALLKALKDRGLAPISFKCGPDYIDPLFHKKVLGIDSRNLDTYFAGSDGIRSVMGKCGEKAAVIEGVMGLYDGISVDGIQGSAYEVASILDTPIVLVVDAKGVGRTIISLIKGVLLDDTKQLIKGVILNKISEGFYESLKPVLEKELGKMRPDVKVLGFFPNNPDISISSRHLGLMLPNEIDDIKRKIELAADNLEKYVDVPGIIAIMEAAKEIDKEACITKPSISSDEDFSELTLAVAYDDAFCFYYRDNLDLFEEYGAKIIYFSPIKDESLPENCDGILFGGGYPENYLKELSQNKGMIASIKNALNKGIPSLAECGGFMYLHKTITGADGTSYDMVGAIDGECHYTGHLVRFGYMEIKEINESADEDELTLSLVGMKGHEFHYFDSSLNGDGFVAAKPFKDISWDCMVYKNNGIWGFPHFYYDSDPKFIRMFLGRMQEVKFGKLQ